MFESIIIRKSVPGAADIDIGLLAECLIFYKHVHVIADMSMLRKLVEHVGLETLEELIKHKYIRLSFSPFITGTLTKAEFSPQEKFDYCTTIKVSGENRQPDFEALFFEMLEKGSGKRGKSKRVGSRILDIIEIIEPNKLVPDDKNILEITRRDLDNEFFVRSAIETAIHHLAPDFKLQQNWEYRVIRDTNGFNIHTNIDLDALNMARSKAHFPDPESKLTRAYLMDAILKANEDLFFSAHYRSEIVTKPITSAIIELKLSELIKKTRLSENTRTLFQQVIINDSRMIRELVNKGERSFKEFLPLLEKSIKFKEWVQQKDDNANLIKEYIKAIIEKTWLQKLPAKILRISLFTGAGLVADAFITGGFGAIVGVAMAVGDNFIIDKVVKGWKPNQYIDEIEKFVS